MHNFQLARHGRNLGAGLTFSMALLSTPFGVAQAQGVANACGPLVAGSVSEGPYDYRVDRSRIAFIESNHFLPQVQALTGGVSGTIGGELSFLLRHVPNHHKALLLLITYGERLKWVQPSGLIYPYECWYERAIRWKPDDAVARMIYAMYLNKHSRTKDALVQLNSAAAVAGDSGFTHYNVGLVYLEMKEYDLALARAHTAQALGFERTELRDRLKAVGKWKEPAPASADTGAAPNDAAAPAAKP